MTESAASIVDVETLVPAPLVPQTLLAAVTTQNELLCELADLQGLRGATGPPGPAVDPDAIPFAPRRAIAAGASLPIPPAGAGSFVWSTLADAILVFDGDRWVVLSGGPTEPQPPDVTAVVNDLGETLVNDLGEVLHGNA